jgi:hypothetical protein
MTTSAELVDELNGTAGRAGYAAFAAGCAARLAPVFESFARTGHGRYADWLAELQACIDAPELARSRKLRGQVKAALEASIDYVLSTPAGSPRAFTGLELRAERESLDMLKSSPFRLPAIGAELPPRAHSAGPATFTPGWEP